MSNKKKKTFSPNPITPQEIPLKTDSDFPSGNYFFGDCFFMYKRSLS